MQRVALARSLVYQPQLLLLDEPLSNLDAQLRLRLRDDLRRIIKQAGVTAVYVTHDQAEAVVLGDRIGVMRAGKLLQMATPDAIYNRPADLFVASFTGASNLLAGRVVTRNGEFGKVEAGGHELTALLPAGVKAGEAVKVAVRPENVRLGVNGAADTNRFTARIAGQRLVHRGVQQPDRRSHEHAILHRFQHVERLLVGMLAVVDHIDAASHRHLCEFGVAANKIQDFGYFERRQKHP
jgi:iron(III) transport system ATP-binding protein